MTLEPSTSAINTLDSQEALDSEPSELEGAPPILILALLAVMGLTIVAVIVALYGRTTVQSDTILPPGSDGHHPKGRPPAKPTATRLPLTSVPPSGKGPSSIMGTVKGQTSSRTSTRPPLLGQHRLPRDVRPAHYKLSIVIHPDVRVQNFSGEVEIELQCLRPTPSISLHAEHSMELRNLSLTGGVGIVRTDRGGKDGDVVTLTLDQHLQSGQKYTLVVEFRNVFAQTGERGFWTDHEQRSNAPKRIAYVKFFEPDGARKAFPCFDEPDAKATFSITIWHWESLTARSNMPLLKSQNRGGVVIDVFQETPAMSTYLVAWVVSDFKRVTKDRVSVWAQQSVPDGSLNAALDVAYRCLEYCENFLGIPYPLPKLDLFGVPSFPFGGMEDWGIISITEKHLFGTAVTSAPSTYLIMHEIFHQWFGDLITTTWWNDIWVQEALTYYLGTVGSVLLEPSEMLGDRLVTAAFKEDQQHGDRPLLFPENSAVGQKVNGDLLQAVLFSAHTRAHYLIRMIHFLLGEDEFKASLSGLLKKYRYKNLNGYDFLRTMTDVQKALPKVDINSHLLPWFESDGFPELIFHRNYSGKTITVQQAPHGNPKRHIYHIPIVYNDNRKQDVWHPLRYNNIDWLTKERDQLQDPRDDQTAILLNPGMVGYLVVNYDNRNWALIGQHLAQDPSMADPFLLGQLHYSARVFYERGDTSLDSMLWLLDGMQRVTDQQLWYHCAETVGYMDNYVVGFNDSGRYQARFLEIMNLTAASLSWDNTSSWQSSKDRNFEIHMRDVLCDMDYFQCVDLVQNAWQMEHNQLTSYQDFLSLSGRLLGQERPTLCLIVRNGDQKTWQKIQSWLAALNDSDAALGIVTAALTCSTDDSLLETAINITLMRGFSWDSIRPPLRYTHRFRRIFLDTFFALTGSHNNETDVVPLAETFLETDEDVQKFGQQLQRLAPSNASEHLQTARKTVARKQQDEPTFLRWLDRQLPPGS